MAGEKEFENLYLGNQPRLVAYASRFVETREAALDIVQDAFIKVWDKYRLLDEEQARKLLFKIVRNSCLDYIKRNKIVSTLAAFPLNSPDGQELLYNYSFSYPSTEETYLMNECSKEVKETLSKLPDRCREVFEMRIYNGLKNREIAERLNISIKAVEKHMKRALSLFDDSVHSDSSALFKVLVLLWLINLA